MRKAEFTNAQIKSAGLELMAQGKKVTGSSLRSILGGGRHDRLLSVWLTPTESFFDEQSVKSNAIEALLKSSLERFNARIATLVLDFDRCLSENLPFESTLLHELLASSAEDLREKVAVLGLKYASRTSDLIRPNEPVGAYFDRFLLNPQKSQDFRAVKLNGVLVDESASDPALASGPDIFPRQPSPSPGGTARHPPGAFPVPRTNRRAAG